jgi:DNA-binding NarL/FixJ family response regulator
MTNLRDAPVLTIVTVDDSSIFADRMQTMLSDISNIRLLGHARNISEALDLINQKKPDVVFLDIRLEENMPDRNGITLLLTLRQKHPDIKIFMLSNLYEPQYKETCMALGAHHFFDKSNDLEKIPEILKSISCLNPKQS